MSDSAFPVTAAITRRPRPGQGAALAGWARGIVEAASSQPGHLAAKVTGPDPRTGALTIMFSFACSADLLAWEGSAERRAWLDKAEPLVDGAPQAHDLVELEALFAQSAGRPAHAPPRYKSAVVIAVALLPLSILVSALVGPRVAKYPVPVRSLVSVSIIVPLMVWVAVPLVSRLLRPWLKGR